MGRDGKRSALTIEHTVTRHSLLTELLQEVGFPVVVPALSLLNAHERALLVPFDVIFVEAEHVDDPAFNFISEMRFGAEDKRRTPIIVVSSDSAVSMVAKARDCGASGFLTRPFSLASLTLQVAGALNLQRQFITSASFAGPDRRRWDDPDYRGPERRRAPSLSDVLID